VEKQQLQNTIDASQAAVTGGTAEAPATAAGANKVEPTTEK